MSRKISRNAPCPCGSGKKYKHCCLNREREAAGLRAEYRDGARIASAWLAANHREAVDDWVEQVWLAGLDETMREGIATADARLRAIHDLNLVEMLISEGALHIDEKDRPALEHVLNGCTALSPAQREYLEALARAPLTTYRVDETLPGEALVLARWPENDEVRPRIEDKWASRAFEAGDVLGLRLVDTPIGLESSGALYHFPEESLHELAQRLDEDERMADGMRIAGLWLELLAAHA